MNVISKIFRLSQPISNFIEKLFKQQRNEDLREIQDRVFLKYFLRYILRKSKTKFPDSIAISPAFTKYCLLKIGNLNQALTLHETESLDNRTFDVKFLKFEPFFDNFVSKLRGLAENAFQFMEKLEGNELVLSELEEIRMIAVKNYDEIAQIWEQFVNEYSHSFRRPFLIYAFFQIEVVDQLFRG